ncbi:MAG: hypothetical protein AVDCRST_MAG59-1454, partial [uncultured Thermomicrobiales bacterium]
GRRGRSSTAIRPERQTLRLPTSSTASGRTAQASPGSLRDRVEGTDRGSERRPHGFPSNL